MKRFYLCPVIGTGTEADPYRPKVHDYGVPFSASIPEKADHSPRFAWCLVKVNAASFAVLDADAELDGFPLVSLDATVTSLPAGVRTRLANALSKRGVDTSDVQGVTTLRAILRRIGRLHDSQFHEDLIDVAG